MSTRLLALLCLSTTVCLGLPAAAAADHMVAVRAEYWSMDLSGDVAVGGDTIGEATDLSLEGDEDGLGLDSDNPVGFSAVFNLGPFFLFGRYIPIDVSGSGTATEPINFGDRTFDIGGELDSSLQLDMVDGGLGLHLLNLDDLPIRVQLGVLVQVKYLDGSVEVRGSSGGIAATEAEDFTLPIPMAGGRLHLGLADFLGVNIQGAAIAFDGNHLYDVEARAEFSPLPFVGISAGYRLLDLAIDESDVELDASFDGPFIEAFVRF